MNIDLEKSGKFVVIGRKGKEEGEREREEKKKKRKEKKNEDLGNVIVITRDGQRMDSDARYRPRFQDFCQGRVTIFLRVLSAKPDNGRDTW